MVPNASRAGRWRGRQAACTTTNTIARFKARSPNRHAVNAPPPHGTVLAWARGRRCGECEPGYQRFVSELALRGPLRLPAQPEPRKLDADTRARLEPAVRRSACPVCGALRHQRCRNLAFPQHFAPTHAERTSGR